MDLLHDISRKMDEPEGDGSIIGRSFIIARMAAGRCGSIKIARQCVALVRAIAADESLSRDLRELAASTLRGPVVGAASPVQS